MQQLPKFGIVGVLKPCCTTRFTRTRLSDIVHPVSSSLLTQDPNRVRSFGGYNTSTPCPQGPACRRAQTRAGRPRGRDVRGNADPEPRARAAG